MKKIKAVLRILVFLSLLICLLSGLNRVMMHKESLEMLTPFIRQAKEYDVLFFGDSMVRAGIYPLELYHKYGIASYNISSANCRIPMGYWRMVNALDYAKPKLVVFSVMDIEWPQLTYDKSERLHQAFDGFPVTFNKVKGILELLDQEGADRNGVPYSDIRAELLFPLRKYHSRWSSLTQSDFRLQYNTQKGALPIVHVCDPDVKGGLVAPDECLPEDGYGYVYLRKIIEECQSRGIDIMLYAPPHAIRPQAHMGTHTAGRIAAEYGVTMLNFPDMNRVVDSYVDYGSLGGHLNTSGAYKLSDYMGQYLTDHYDLPDRREDPAYAHWHDEWNAFVDEKIRMIDEDANNLRTQLMLLHDQNFNAVVTIRPGFDYDQYQIKTALQNIGRAHAFEDNMLVSAELKPLNGLNDAADFNKGYMFIVDWDAVGNDEIIHEFYGIGEQEFETSFGYVFCRMDGEWIDLSITQGDTETYYFDNWDDQDQDIRVILIDRSTGKPALIKAFSSQSVGSQEEPTENAAAWIDEDFEDR